MTPIRLVLRHPTLRLIATALLVLGGLNASVYPYQSLIAIERFGMSKPAFSLMLALASVIAVVSSVGLGLLGDQFGHRRVQYDWHRSDIGLSRHLGAGALLGRFAAHGLKHVWPVVRPSPLGQPG